MKRKHIRRRTKIYPTGSDRKLIILLSTVLFILAIPVSAIVNHQTSNAVSPAVASTTLSFSQAAIAANPGDSISSDVIMNPGQNSVSYINLVINYDSSVITPTANGIVANSTAFPVTLAGPTYNTCSATSCTMSVELSIGSNPTKAITQQTTVATVNFTAVANGTTQLGFTTTQVLSTGPSDSPNENVLLTGTASTVTIGNGVSTSNSPSPTSATQTPSPTGSSCTCPTPPTGCVTPTPGGGEKGEKHKFKCGWDLLRKIHKDSDKDVDQKNLRKQCDVPSNPKDFKEWLADLIKKLKDTVANVAINLLHAKISTLPANASTTLAFGNAPQTANTGDTITMNVAMNPGQNRVSYIDVFISYDASLVQPTTDGLVPNSAIFPDPSDVLSGPNYNVCNGNLCTMDIALSVGSDPTKAITQPTTIATVKFTAMSPGTAQISFDNQTQVLSIAPTDGASENVFAGGTASTITISGNSILTPSPTGSQSPSPTGNGSPTNPPTQGASNTPTPTGGSCVCPQTKLPICKGKVSISPTKKPEGDDDKQNCKGHGAEMEAVSPGVSPVQKNCK